MNDHLSWNDNFWRIWIDSVENQFYYKVLQIKFGFIHFIQMSKLIDAHQFNRKKIGSLIYP